MLKKSMKAVLTAAAIASVSTVAMAEAKVSGSAAAYFGQYNTGADTAAAHFESVGEGNLWLKGSNGNMSYAVEFEQRSNVTDANYGRIKLAYKMDKLKFEIGELTTGVQYSIVSGTKTSSTGSYGVYKGTETYQQNQGAGVSFAIDKGMSAGLVLYTNDGKGNEGSSTVGYFNGTFGQLGVKVSMLSGTADDFDSDADTTTAVSNSLIGVKFKVDDKLSVSADIVNESQENADGTKDSDSDTALQVLFGMDDATVKATYAMRTTKDDDEKKSSNTYLAAIYDVKVADGAGIQAVYATDAVKYETETTTNVNKTSTFIGAGFYSKF